MEFKEIFDKDGLYTSDDFVEGYCLEVINGVLAGVQYKDANDIMPKKNLTSMYRGLLYKDYRKVYTRQSLFKDSQQNTQQQK